MRRRAALLLALAAACDPDPPGRAEAPAASPPPRDVGPRVSLRARAEGDRVVTDITVRGASRVIHGAALRLRWDPAALAFVEARAGEAWSPGAVALAKEGLPGELVAVWTEKGPGGGVTASAEEILGTLTFRRKTSAAATIAFRPERSTLRDAEGVAIDVAWEGADAP